MTLPLTGARSGHVDSAAYLDLIGQGVRALAHALQDALPPGVDTPDWNEHEALLRRSKGPMPDLVRRFDLDTLAIQCLYLALIRHLEPESASAFDPTLITIAAVKDLLCADDAQRRAAEAALQPDAPLVRHGLLRLETTTVKSGALTKQILLSPAALNYLLCDPGLHSGVASLARLAHPRVSLLNVIVAPDKLSRVRELVEHQARYRALIQDWGLDELLPYGLGLTFLFAGPSGTGKTLLSLALASHIGAPLVTLSAGDVPEREGGERLLRAAFEEATIRDAVVVLDHCEALLAKADPRRAAVTRVLEEFEGIAILITNHPERLDESVDRLVGYNLRFPRPGPSERRQIWEVHMPPRMPVADDIELDVLANSYDFTGAAIKNAVLVAVSRALAEGPAAPVVTMARLLEGCGTQLGYALEALTVQTRSQLTFADIVLPDEAQQRVKEVIAAVRNQSLVLNAWGLGQRLTTGVGITVLFDGPPGTGKTLCAEIVAAEFDRAVHRVNLPEVVSKWVGETEKNIREIFQGARASHAMLLFDEADALFSARTSETKSATDRYANMEVNLLLQEIERFPGVVFLTTNFYGVLDKALLRRIQFRVSFEEPEAEQRRRIWEVLIPAQLPMADDVDLAGIAKHYELNGGRIKNALLRASYRAAEAGSPVTQRILWEACRDGYKAAGKVIRDPSKQQPRKPRPRELNPDPS